MKSQVNGLLTVARGLCKDVRAAYPSYGDISKDEERLARLVKDRGMGAFALDLPALDSLLTKGLEDGRLSLKGPVSNRVSKRIQVPRLFAGLWLRIFDRHSVLRPDADPTAIAILRQFCCLGKKMVAACTSERVKDTINEYHAIESGLRNPTLGWDDDDLCCDSSFRSVHFRDSVDPDLPLFPAPRERVGESVRIRALLERLQRFADEFSQGVPFLEPCTASQRCYDSGSGTGFGHGPGAVADKLIGVKNKYQFPNWPAKLQEWFPFEECGVLNAASTYQVGTHEVPSRLITVPKTAKAPRLIAAEPVQYMFTQRLIKNFLEEHLSVSALKPLINFRDQGRSRELARIASLSQEICTVDLSSASDRLSCWVVERTFRRAPSLLAGLHATRTRWMVDRISQPPIFFKKKKFASQGTAVTFPVQTVIYCLVALACLPGRNLKDVVRRHGNKVQVFGDDIIMPSSGYADLCLLLDHLQLKVNKEKSFVNGSFKESCGFDAFKGYDVTPVKPQGLQTDGPQSRASIIDFTNNLFKKGYWHASDAAKSIAGAHPFMRAVPVTGPYCEGRGFTSFSGSFLGHLRSRWSDRYQRWEVKVLQLTAKASKKKVDDISSLLQFVTENPSPELAWESGVAVKPKVSDGLRWAPTYSYT